MAAERIAGIAFFRADGISFSLRGSFKIQPLSTTKEGIAGQDSIHGFKEIPVVPMIEGEISDRGALSVSALQSINNATITAELANGKVYVLRNAWYAGPAEIDASDGKLMCKFEGLSMIEVPAL